MSSCAPQLNQTVTGSFVPPSRHVTKVYLHCSAASRESVDAAEVHRWHTEEPNNWDCIGYHFFLKTDATLQYGRTLERDPAAQYPYNAGTIAICLNGHYVEDFNEEQFNVLRDWCHQINRALNVTFHGHNEVAARECPVFDYRAVLDLDAAGNMLWTPPEPAVEVPSEPKIEIPAFDDLPDNWQAKEALKRLAEARFWARESLKSGF